MNISFKPITDEYLQDAVNIYNHYVKNTTVTFHTEPLAREDMKEILYQDVPYLSFGIFDGEEFCGYSYMAPYKKRQAYRISSEVTLYLDPKYTGKGIGTMAIKHLEAHAKAQGIHSLLSVVCAENEASIKLFMKNGYVQCAHFKEIGIKFGRMLDIIVLQKILN